MWLLATLLDSVDVPYSIIVESSVGQSCSDTPGSVIASLSPSQVVAVFSVSGVERMLSFILNVTSQQILFSLSTEALLKHMPSDYASA